jgi:hypothetical protein
MNRNLKGELFSRDELIDMAVEIGAVDRDKVTRDDKTWTFWHITRAHRLEMFFRGEAILDTRLDPPKPPVKSRVDWETLASLGVFPS